MAIIKKEIYLDMKPEQAWKIVGDVGGISKWSPIVEREELSGDNRVCTMPDGNKLHEKILSRDSVNYKYEYTITKSPFPMESHHAYFQVVADGQGCKVVWVTELTPDALVREIEPMAEQNMMALKSYLNGI